eukprot:CAMPEP_0174911058 /NCGR_PEP_ID=MMETSP0167-20121228/75179_1 /TAXON_ID=38298 /ORGANISM="Rhodella maculata, Strain CCMP736" /LENGTH=958 /DNA_ID=CAMNT_0016155485 /DNA_START=81 /DNA_END=2957 /DNA_ORIENTATION=-
MPYKTRVRFSVHYKPQEGERVVLVGESLLGGWDPFRGIELTADADSNWHGVVPLPIEKHFEYKYVLMRDVDGEISSQPTGEVIRYESFDGNRAVDSSGYQMTVDDGEFDAENASDPTRVKINEQVFESPIKKSPAAAAMPVGDAGAAELDLAEGGGMPTLMVVLYRLPIIARKEAGKWVFRWDDDALYLTSLALRKSSEGKANLLWVGVIDTQEEIPETDRADISRELKEKFNCVPVYIDLKTRDQFYNGFCKGILWPILHMTVKFWDNGTVTFDRHLWQVYCAVNRKFSETVVEHYTEGSMVWIHDYHLMVLPTYLRSRLPGAKIGFFLHTPWPSSELYRLLPVRDEILRGLLSSTLVGFHLFDYARHFLSCCVRLLNLEHEARRGILGVQYAGRHVMVRVSHVGIYPARFTERLGHPGIAKALEDLHINAQGKFILGAIDDIDYVKGISLKLTAFESILTNYPAYRSKVTLIQVAVPKSSKREHAVADEIVVIAARINSMFGTDSYKPVHLIVRNISFDERIAIYGITNALMLTPIRDGLNLIPYEYILCAPEGKGQLILSEFTGCSRAIVSALRVNPWNFQEVLSAIDRVLQRDPEEIKARHKSDVKYVLGHSTENWSSSFLYDLERASEPVHKLTKLGIGFGMGNRLLEFEGFEHLGSAMVVKQFKSCSKRLFLLDYDGTLAISKNSTLKGRMSHAWARPDEFVMGCIDQLTSSPLNVVYVMSGRTATILEKSFEGITNVGLCAEHGFQYQNPGSTEWLMLEDHVDLEWLEVAYEVMQSYTERTDGSYVEEKSAGLVWHYLDADPDFGEWQAKELHGDLEDVMSPFPVEVVSGSGWLQVRSKSLNKGKMVEKILERLGEAGKPDFVMCMGDDRTDEDMFVSVHSALPGSESLFTCTVGVKPSNAKFYLRNHDEVSHILASLCAADDSQWEIGMNREGSLQKHLMRSQSTGDKAF